MEAHCGTTEVQFFSNNDEITEVSQLDAQTLIDLILKLTSMLA
jgi:hypothetical protein